jgi:signal transduction histidine kinase
MTRTRKTAPPIENKPLARWLEEHREMLGSPDREEDQTFHVALYEGLIEMALHGDTRMVNSLVESAAANAVAIGRELTHLLGVPERLRARTWQRLGEEIDPEPAFAMLSALDAIFVYIVKTTIDAYLEATKLAHAAKSAEIARLYTESEQKVMKYATEVARANRELDRLEKAKTDFISIAAHELKTPLTLIQGYVNILKDLSSEGQAKKLTEGISRGTERMNNIIEDMLDLSAMDMKQLGLVMQKVNLKKSIDLVITQSQPALEERRQTVETVQLDSLGLIDADARRLHQVFRQILSNAIKYTPDGGHITISGREMDGQKRVQLTFQDTGVGIAPEDKEKIFEKFYRAGSSALHSTGQVKFMGAGPGLGLAIVKGLIEAHGGRITVDSPGFDMQNCPGSTFIVVLPVRANPRPGIHIQWLEPGQPEVREVNAQPETPKEEKETP